MANPTPIRYLREVEVSVNSACTLACAHCGFLVPNQPHPFVDDPAIELGNMLARFSEIGVRIGSLALLGGEATLAKRALAAMITVAHNADCVQRIELVTNGLTPKGLALECLSSIHRLSLSDYTQDEELAEAWQKWLAETAPHTEFVVRKHDTWDAWDGDVDLGEDGGQDAYDRCWYRRHCVTLERRRIFVCSRIPKLNFDEQGLEVGAGTTLQDVVDYLDADKAPLACQTCTPMAGLPSVSPGVQPDDRLAMLRTRALTWFAEQGAI